MIQFYISVTIWKKHFSIYSSFKWYQLTQISRLKLIAGDITFVPLFFLNQKQIGISHSSFMCGYENVGKQYKAEACWKTNFTFKYVFRVERNQWYQGIPICCS